MEQKNIDSVSEFVAEGSYEISIIRNGKVIDKFKSKNIVTTEGRDYFLNAAMRAGAQVSPWYMGVFEGNYTPVAGDTAATFPASATESTAYNEATRPEYVETAPSAGSLSNTGNVATFTMNATKTIYGLFLSSVSTKSATTGTLLSAVKFPSSRNVIATDIVQVTYTLSLTSA